VEDAETRKDYANADCDEFGVLLQLGVWTAVAGFCFCSVDI